MHYGSVIFVFFLKKLTLLFSKDVLNWSNAVLLKFLFIKISRKIKCISFHKNIVQHNSTLIIIIRNASWAVYYYDFWRSCDTEDWSNYAENAALIKAISCILQYNHIKKNSFILNSNNISLFWRVWYCHRSVCHSSILNARPSEPSLSTPAPHSDLIITPT